MSHPPPDVGSAEALVGQEPVDVTPEVRPDQFGDLDPEDDAEPGGADVPSHGSLTVGVEAAPGRHDLGQVLAGSPSTACHDHGGGAIAEQPAGNEVGHGGVVALNGQAAQLHREEDGDAVGVAEQVVVDACDSRGARDTAQPHERDSLDVLAQPDAGGDPRVDRGHGQPRDGGRDDEVDVGRRQRRGLQRVLQSL
jgi:hypothetical protein